MSDRYEVREHILSEEYRNRVHDIYPDCPEIMYRVWDTHRDKVIPFGNHSSRDRAQSHADLRNGKEAQS